MPRATKKPKDLSAPKKNQSSYFLFSNERRRSLQPEYAGKSAALMSKQISTEWRALSAEDNQKYKDMAVSDKARYLEEMAIYCKTDSFKQHEAVVAEWKERSRENGVTIGGKNASKNAPKKPKQPSAMPKRPQTSYFVFANERRVGMREQYPDKKLTDLSKLIGNEWKAKSAEEKVKYESVAKIAKERYTVLMKEYKETEEFKLYDSKLSQWQQNMKYFKANPDAPGIVLPRKPKDTNAPKRPLTSYFIFASKVRQSTKEQFPDMSVTDLAREISKKWKLLSEEEKTTYNSEAAGLKEQYKTTHAAYQGSQHQLDYQKKLEEWSLECDRRTKKAKDKAAHAAELAKANRGKTAKGNKSSNQKKGKSKKKRRDYVSDSDSDSDSGSSRESGSDSDSDSDSSSGSSSSGSSVDSSSD